MREQTTELLRAAVKQCEVADSAVSRPAAVAVESTTGPVNERGRH